MNVQKPKPIFIIGAARTGTTNLCNKLSELSNVAGVTSIYHYGNCESKILRNQLHWGRLTRFENFLNFIGHVQYSDYFMSAGGEITTVIKNHPEDYFIFYLDLMDSFASKQQKSYWVTKLDDLFFIYPNLLKEFLNLLSERYGKDGFKVITIRRELNASVLSYLFMEGKYSKIRKLSIGKSFAVFLQTLRYKFIYQNAVKFFPNAVNLDFKAYTQNPNKVLNEIHFLKSGIVSDAEQDFMINSSFNSKKEKILKREDIWVIKLACFVHKLQLTTTILNIYNKFHKINNPLYYREFMHVNHPDLLKKDLEKREAFDLVNKLNLK